jgi:hypothetical protein
MLGVSAIGFAQTQAVGKASFPQRNSEKYWLVVDEFADGAVHLAYATRFVQLHEGALTDRQCHQCSRIIVDYVHQLSALRQAGVAQSEFWERCGRVLDWDGRSAGGADSGSPIQQVLGDDGFRSGRPRVSCLT